MYGCVVRLAGWWTIPSVALAAFAATTVESLIGATAQGRFGWLTNEVVNFINTLIGAIVGIALVAIAR